MISHSRRTFLLTAVPALAAPAGERAPRIWDAHCHLTATGETPEQRVTELIRVAERMGIERIALSMGMKWAYEPTPQELRQQNDDVLRAVTSQPDRTLGFVYTSPAHPEASVAEIERCVHDGPMVGVKLWVAMRAAAPALDSIVERAAALNAVLFQHTFFKAGGNLPGESTPLDLVELARRHPGASFLCGHTGGDWERGIRAIRDTANIYADISGSDATAGMVEMAVRELGAERVVFGSDAGGRSFASQLGKVMGAEIPDSARRLILGKNLRRLLRPILAAKGVRA